MSSSVTMTSSSEKSQGLYRSKTPTNGQPFGPSGPNGLSGLNGHARSNGYYPYSPYLSYNPMQYGVPTWNFQVHIHQNIHLISIYTFNWRINLYYRSRSRLKIKNGQPDPPGTPMRNLAANYQAPYRAAVIPIVTTRSTGTGHGPSRPGPANMENGFGQVISPPLIPQSPHLNAHA